MLVILAAPRLVYRVVASDRDHGIVAGAVEDSGVLGRPQDGA
jgi:hypothetical protein